MEKKSNISSRFKGFVDEYKASNIASIESSIEYHFEEITDRISLLISEIGDKELLQLLAKISGIIEDSNSDYYKLIQFGESFKTIVLMLKTRNLNTILDNPNIRMIVYHYLEMAERIGDNRINALAIEIGELFQGA